MPKQRAWWMLLAAVGLFGSAWMLWQSRPPHALLQGKDVNVVLCVLDAARPDHFGCYGYPRNTTPNIDRLARKGLLFEQHFTQATFTKASTASLFTSQYAESHLVLRNEDDPGIAQASFTLAEAMAAAGLKTTLFSANPWVDPREGMGAGFEEAYALEEIGRHRSGEEGDCSPEPLLRLFRRWLSEHRRERFFAYLHIMVPHEPYDQPGRFTELFDGERPPGYQQERYRPGHYDVPIGEEGSDHPPLPEWINLYDANLRYADWAVGEVEARLREAGVLGRTLLVITADHGEAFGEHGYAWHEGPIHGEVSHIPLLVVLPEGRRTGRIAALTQTIDLLPTLCEMVGAAYPRDQVQGQSLVPLILGKMRQVNEYVFTRGKKDDSIPSDCGKYAIRNQTHALVLFEEGGWRMLYDLKADPGETVDVAGQEPEVEKQMLDAFHAFAARQRRPPLAFLGEAPPEAAPAVPRKSKLTPERERELRALGYMH